jgi:hypothetical protein
MISMDTAEHTDNSIQKMLDLIEHFESNASSPVESPLRQHLGRCCPTTTPMVASDSENMSSLKNYLILSNDHMKSMVASFIYKNVNLKKSEYANIDSSTI